MFEVDLDRGNIAVDGKHVVGLYSGANKVLKLAEHAAIHRNGYVDSLDFLAAIVSYCAQLPEHPLLIYGARIGVT